MRIPHQRSASPTATSWKNIRRSTIDPNNASAPIVPIFRCQLVREPTSQPASVPSGPITRPDQLAKAVAPLFDGADREIFVALALDVRHRPIGSNVVSVGTLSASIVHPRETFKFAILAGAAAIALAHCHPSGDPTPSQDDINLTRRMIEAGKVVGIDVIDHLILTLGGDWVSLKDMGLM